MFVAKKSLNKRKPQKKTPNNKIIDASAQVKRLTKLLITKENQLQQSQRLNRLYLNQINRLQDDNLALCARSQELKAIEQRTSRQFSLEGDRMKTQVQQLLNVIRYLQEQNEAIRNQNVSLKIDIQQMETEAENGRVAQLEREEVSIQLEKTKKYWMTRCQTLLCEKQNQFQRKLLSKQSQFTLKQQTLQKDILLKQREIQSKTEEIYKLISHIRSKN